MFMPSSSLTVSKNLNCKEERIIMSFIKTSNFYVSQKNKKTKKIDVQFAKSRTQWKMFYENIHVFNVLSYIC